MKRSVKSIIALLILALSGSVMGQARPAAVYVPRSFKELDDARGVTLQPNFVPIWTGTWFTPRLIGESDVTDLVSDLAALQPLDAVLTALSSLTPALDKVPYFTGLDTAATFDITSFGRTILSSPTAAQLRVYAETRHNVDVPTVVDPVTRRTSVPVDPDLLIVDNENKGWLQTLEIADDETITFSGTSLPGYVTHFQVLNSDTADHVLTIPSSYSFARDGAKVPITSITIPDGASAELSWRYEAATGRYYLVGDPLAATSMIYDLQSPPKLAGDFENRVLYDEDGTSKALAWAGGGITLFSGLGSGSSNILPAGGSGSYIYQFPTRAGFIAISNAAPPSGSPNDFLNADGDYITLDLSGGTWGDITGTLADQTDLQAALDAKGAGTVTSFSAGDLSPFFTTSEATATTTPELTFALSNAAAWSIVGNGTSGSAAPAFETATGTGSPVRATGPTFTGTAGFAGATFSTSLASTTALATPSALSATQFTGFASTVSGASLMGYGTTNDVSLMNRAGTVVLGVGPNTTAINIPGKLGIGGAASATYFLKINSTNDNALMIDNDTSQYTSMYWAHNGTTKGQFFFNNANAQFEIGGGATGVSLRLLYGLAATAVTWNGTTGAATHSTAATFSSTLSVTGASTLTGGLIGGVQSLSGAGAVNVTTVTTKLTSTGIAQALTLADGTNGQIKTIVYAAEGGGTDTMVLTPTTATGYTIITFTAIGNAVTLQFFTTQGWMIVSVYGATVT